MFLSSLFGSNHFDHFSVGLSFNQTPSILTIPYAAITAFVDPSVDFGLQFQVDGGQVKVVLEGEDVSRTIRSQEVSDAASKVAVFPRVREALLRRQRAFRQLPGLIADGRDMGTVVFPEAEVKIFLDASAEERAQRRYKQLQDKGFDVNFERLLTEIRERDDRDRNRAVAPLKAAEDALVVDSTAMTIDEVLATVLAYAEHQLGDASAS